jgi:transcription elongation factor Elf1
MVVMKSVFYCSVRPILRSKGVMEMSDINCIYCGSDNVTLKDKGDNKVIIKCNDCGKNDYYI